MRFWNFMRASKVLKMNYKFEYNKLEWFSIFYLFASVYSEFVFETENAKREYIGKKIFVFEIDIYIVIDTRWRNCINDSMNKLLSIEQSDVGTWKNRNKMEQWGRISWILCPKSNLFLITAIADTAMNNKWVANLSAFHVNLCDFVQNIGFQN